ncbi:Crp/Fnr family transcriptional regulator [Deltaproteobacteria bacterium]|nr:Crp/Fnr family transcriptional regulator [Deltaproteobacteria bacterium]
MDDLSQQEELIEQYINEGNQEEAAKALFDLIVVYAKKKDFSKAEALRDRLFEVAPMALNEITKSGDIIDEEKSSSIDEDHRETWSELYDALKTEEVNVLYFAMKENSYDKDKAVYSVGDRNNNLYFVDKGELKMVYTKEDEEILIKNLGPGDLTGEDTFFYTTAFKTVSLITCSQAKLHYIEKGILEKWQEKFPGIESKLYEYCRKSGRVHDLLEKKGLDRRIQKRLGISGRVTVQLLNASGGPSGKPFAGGLSDISVNGLSFSVKISKKETARKLLGLKLNMKFALPGAEAPQKTDQNGTLVGIGYPVFADYSIHVRLDKPFDEKIIEKVGA